MYKVLVVVDMQKDFIDGALGFDGAEKIIPGIAAKIKECLYARYSSRELYGNSGREEASGSSLH